MALTGTLKDFGIAEILQLIGQQAKSGVLHLKNRSEEIHVLWADGNVVRAEHAGRQAKERLGGLLVRAGLLSEEQLRRALDTQQRTLRRLGDVLVDLRMVTKEDLREISSLQTTETVYKLFHWKSGTYEFEPGTVEWDRETSTPLRAESVLMEGFRQVDEWPMIRRKITSNAMTFERLKAPPPEPEGEPPQRTVTRTLTGSQRLAAGVGDDVEAAFGALAAGHKPERGDPGAIGEVERRILELAVPGRTVERIVDLSRLGEFEACKALLTLLNLEYLAPVAPSRSQREAEAGVSRGWGQRLRAGAAGVAVTLAIAVALAGLGYRLGSRGGPSGEGAFRDGGAQRFLARYQSARLATALEIYRLERGEYPPALSALVEEGIVAPRDLRFPWSRPYHYRRTAEGGFVLLPPVE